MISFLSGTGVYVETLPFNREAKLLQTPLNGSLLAGSVMDGKKTGKPQTSCQFSTSAPSAPIGCLHSEHCPATTEKLPAKLAGAS